MRLTICLPLMLYSGCTLAQQAGQAAPLPATASVDIVATRDRARQLDTAAMTVVGREELLRFGDQSVGDALKRVPGITVSGVPGRGGELRMRGLGAGYTRLLLNGQPVPSGFSIDSIAPEQIERVEVMRVATADTGAQAIAGTINIVLRKAGARPEREFKAALAYSHAQWTPELSGQYSGKFERASVALGVVAVDARSRVASSDIDSGVDDAGAPNLRREGREHKSEHRSTVNLTPRLAWTLANGDSITAQSFVRVLALGVDNQASERTTLGDPTAFPDSATRHRARATTVRSDLQWLRQTEQGGRLEVQLALQHFQRRASNDFEGDGAPAAASVVRVVDASAREQSWSLSGKFTAPQQAGHLIVAGWDGGRGERTETRRETDSTVGADSALETSTAHLARLAVYVQDDWTLSDAVALSAGTRYEVVDIASGGTLQDPVSPRFYAGGPLLQARLKTSKQGQLRLGLTRTFKLPTLANLSMRRYTVDNGNSPLAPDEQGNGALLPERAWGLDLAYEHYFSSSAMLSASGYARRIDDVTISRVEQRGVRWISTPSNAGRALARGLELEGKATLGGFALRANGALNWSRIDSLPAPGNHLPNQAPFSAGFGLDRRFASVPLTVSASLTIQGGTRSRLSERVLVDNTSVRELGLVGLWQLDARSSWRLSGANLLAQRHDSAARYSAGAAGLRTVTATPTWATFRLVYERRL
ncbi:TonB-dependent receptor plug domain-containing protein [Massilia sp. DWR3-1-1]|uniref:TonB-dependent receptor plug domain-containing protein n=1 Tax=Massilia sp. DWR3-1-1 TaxID=2804559 RepID=UPI003CEF3CD1